MRTWQDAADTQRAREQARTDQLIADLRASGECCGSLADHVESAIDAGFMTHLNTTAVAADTATAETPNT